MNDAAGHVESCVATFSLDCGSGQGGKDLLLAAKMRDWKGAGAGTLVTCYTLNMGYGCNM